MPLVSLGPHATALMWYYLACGCALASAVLVLVCQQTGLYRKAMAIRDDEVVAETAGIPTMAIKIGLFTAGALVASLAGSLNFYHAIFIDPTTAFSILVTTYAILMPILGGTHTWAGPIAGALIIQSIGTWLTVHHADRWNNVVLGLFLGISVLFLKDGLLGSSGRIFGQIAERRQLARMEREAPGGKA